MIGSLFKAATDMVEDALDVGIAVVTLGEYGELNKQNVSRLIASGMTVYAISEATCVTVELIEKALEE